MGKLNEKLVDFPNIAAFRPGYWNEEEYGPDFTAKLAKSFAFFSKPDPVTGEPFYKPYVSINHDQFAELAGFQFGQLENVRVDKDKILRIDANDVPEGVGNLVQSKALRQPSIEFATPVKDASGKLVGGMRGPDGKVYDGPVIKCLTFLGNDVPGVKGLPDLPSPVPARSRGASFADCSIRKFKESNMDRQQMIEALTEAGVDVSTITDTVPDEFLAAVLKGVQAGNANPGEDAASMAQFMSKFMAQFGSDEIRGKNQAGQKRAMWAKDPESGITTSSDHSFDDGGIGDGINHNDTGNQPGDMGNKPSAITVKFNQQFPGLLGNLTSIVGQLNRQAASVRRTQADIVDNAKDSCIQAFFDRTQGSGGSGQLTEAELPRLRSLLMKLDHGTVRRFSDLTLKNTANGRRVAATGTELEEFIADLERTRPVLRTFGHRTPQRPIQHGGNSTGGLTADRRARILKGAGFRGELAAK